MYVIKEIIQGNINLLKIPTNAAFYDNLGAQRPADRDENFFSRATSHEYEVKIVAYRSEHSATRGRMMYSESDAGDGAAGSTTFSLILVSVSENAASFIAKYSSFQSLRAESQVLTEISPGGLEIDTKCWGMCAMRLESAWRINQPHWESIRAELEATPRQGKCDAGVASFDIT
jgi:hypothetical protein